MWIPARGKLAVSGRFGNVGVPPDRVRAGPLTRRFHPSAAWQASATRWAAARSPAAAARVLDQCRDVLVTGQR